MKIGNYRNSYDAIRKSVLDDLVEVLKEADDNEIQLDDNNGSLIYQSIDDQENLVILSIYLRYPKDPVAKIGVYSDDFTVPLEEMSLEMILNITDAVKVAIND